MIDELNVFRLNWLDTSEDLINNLFFMNGYKIN